MFIYFKIDCFYLSKIFLEFELIILISFLNFEVFIIFGKFWYLYLCDSID